MTEEEILNKEIAKATEALGGARSDQMKEEIEKLKREQAVYEALSKDFPEDAYTKDSSRGFDLTSVKAQYIVERLNEAVGVMNWTFGGDFKETDNGVIYMGVLVLTINGRQNRQFAPGYAANKKNLGDTYKSAHTDSLSKAASKYGVANSVFKGLVEPPGATKRSTTRTTKKTVSKTASTVETAKDTPTATKKPSSFQTRRTRPTLSKG
ncbi:MAG: hypothetical protein COB41_00600 [Proteobacteria bacterium]|nr:MAG: hypothetical protein COB41_00600 [Pseudomonadota bacterium]